MTSRDRLSLRAALTCTVAGAALLAACSSIHWERAFYEGFRHNAARSDPAQGQPPAQNLPPYDTYEAERQRLARDAAASQPAR